MLIRGFSSGGWIAQWESICFMIQQSKFNSARSQRYLTNWWEVFCARATKTHNLNILKSFVLYVYELINHDIYWTKYEAEGNVA